MGFFDKDAIIGKLKTIKDAAVESTKEQRRIKSSKSTY